MTQICGFKNWKHKGDWPLIYYVTSDRLFPISFWDWKQIGNTKGIGL